MHWIVRQAEKAAKSMEGWSPGARASMERAACTEAELIRIGWSCDGCGSAETIEQIRARLPQAISCCPERRLVPPVNIK